MYRTRLPLAAALATLGATGASAAHLDYFSATLSPLNDSGVFARASFTVNANAGTLRTRVLAFGVESGLHPQHIHGRLADDGSPVDSVTPPPNADTTGPGDGDGFVEITEGAPFYGPILVNLTDDGGMFPTASGTSYDFQMTYDLNDPTIYDGGFGLDELLGVGDTLEIADDPRLDLREIVIHGRTVPDGAGEGTPFEVDGGENGYIAALPVASGEIVQVDAPAPVPLPAAAWLLLAGMGGLGALGLRRS